MFCWKLVLVKAILDSNNTFPFEEEGEITHQKEDANIHALGLKNDINKRLEHLKMDVTNPFHSRSSSTLLSSFDITLEKKDGSLGFTIHKKEDGFLYVKEVVREPALLEPLMTPGDRILLVNGVDVSLLTHEGAISYLRSLSNKVTLKMLPMIPEDIVEEMDISSEGYSSLRKQLRPEARMMIRKKSSTSSTTSDATTTNSLSRLRLRKEKLKARQENQTENRVAFESNYNYFYEPERLIVEEEEVDKVISRNEINVSPAVVKRNESAKESSTSLFSPLTSNCDNRMEVINNSPHLNDDGNESIPTFSSLLCLVDDSLESKQDRVKQLKKSQSSDVVVAPCSPSHVHLDIVVDKKKIVTQLSSDNMLAGIVTNEEPTSKLSKWRGTNLIETPHHEPQESSPPTTCTRKDKDSGFGDSVSRKSIFENSLEKPIVRSFVEVTLEKGWTSRLGIQLMDDESQTPPIFCVVKSIIPDTVAYKDGRIKPGFKMTTVNGQNLEGKSAKEVIEFLRRVKGKVHMKFLVFGNNNTIE